MYLFLPHNNYGIKNVINNVCFYQPSKKIRRDYFFFIKHKSFFSQIIKSNFEIIEVLLEFQFLVKYDSKIFVLVDKWDFV